MGGFLFMGSFKSDLQAKQEKMQQSNEGISVQTIKDRVAQSSLYLYILSFFDTLEVEKFDNGALIATCCVNLQGLDEPTKIIVAVKSSYSSTISIPNSLPIGPDMLQQYAKDCLSHYMSYGFGNGPAFGGTVGSEIELAFSPDVDEPVAERLRIELNKFVGESPQEPLPNPFDLALFIKSVGRELGEKYYMNGWAPHLDDQHFELNDEDEYVAFMIEVIKNKLIAPEGKTNYVIQQLARTLGFENLDEMQEQVGLGWLQFMASHVHIGIDRLDQDKEIIPLETLLGVSNIINTRIGALLDMLTYNGAAASGTILTDPHGNPVADARAALREVSASGKGHGPISIDQHYQYVKEALADPYNPSHTATRTVPVYSDGVKAYSTYGGTRQRWVDKGTTEFVMGSATSETRNEMTRNFLIQCLHKLVLIAQSYGYPDPLLFLQNNVSANVGWLLNHSLGASEHLWEFTAGTLNWASDLVQLWYEIFQILDKYFLKDNIYEYGKKEAYAAINRLFYSFDHTGCTQGIEEYYTRGIGPFWQAVNNEGPLATGIEFYEDSTRYTDSES